MTRFLLLFCMVCQLVQGAPYLTLIGKIKRADGLGRQTLEMLELYKSHFSVNCIATRPPDYADVSNDLKKLIHYEDKQTTPLGHVVLFEECLWFPAGKDHYKLVAKPKRDDQIRIAYSMFDATEIPEEFTSIINLYFDAVAVPDKFLIDVYQKGGVNVPIFELPLGLDLQKLLKKPIKGKKKSPFVFSFLGGCVKRKNQVTLVRAFDKAFKKQPNVLLFMNSRYADLKCYLEVMNELKLLNNPRITFQRKTLDTNAYIKALLNTDCLVNVSKGEGFSIQPREAMALGIPAIVSDNTAQCTLCESGLVKAVPSLIREKAYSTILNRVIGEDFNCEVDDVAAALRDVYENYDAYLALSQEMRAFAESYDYAHMKERYLNLVRPKELYLGDVNEITESGLTTSSQELYEKYQRVMQCG